MELPLLMPHQLEPFNGDSFICDEVLKLKNQFDIKKVIETGTCFGGTTVFLAKNFQKVHTVEYSEQYYVIAKQRFNENECFNI